MKQLHFWGLIRLSRCGEVIHSHALDDVTDILSRHIKVYELNLVVFLSLFFCLYLFLSVCSIFII